MKISYQCSNCGQKFQVRAMVGVPDGMYIEEEKARYKDTTKADKTP